MNQPNPATESAEQPISECLRCRKRLNNGGIPKFYASTESDAGGVYPAMVRCEQCGHEVRCGTTREPAVSEWNREQKEQPQAPQRPEDVDEDIADASEQIAAMLQKDESLTLHDAAVSLWIRASDERDRAEQAEAQLSATKADLKQIRDAGNVIEACGHTTSFQTARESGFYCIRCRVEQAEAELARVKAERDRLRDAGQRLLKADYLPWTNAGGPNECVHGYADGIPCRKCDEQLFIARAALTPLPAKEKP